MHESDSFISEVSEEVRRERLYGFLRRWGWLVALLLLAIIGGSATYQWMKHRERVSAAAAGDALTAAYAEADPAKRAGDLAALAAEDPPGAALFRIAAAGSKAEAGDSAGAAELLAGVAGDAAVPALYRDLAALQRVILLGNGLAAAERLTALESLAQTEAPFRPLALEQRALAHLDAGDAAAAQTDLQAALADPRTPQALRSRVGQLLVTLGGLPPAAPATLPADG